jgi:hypothetical protein
MTLILREERTGSQQIRRDCNRENQGQTGRSPFVLQKIVNDRSGPDFFGWNATTDDK